MLICKKNSSDNCMCCSHSKYHTKSQCKKFPAYRTYCDGKIGCREVLPERCKGCEFLIKNTYCLLSEEVCEKVDCLKGKVTIEHIILILNEILPHIFSNRSHDMTSVASALIRYPNYSLSTKDFISIRSTSGGRNETTKT